MTDKQKKTKEFEPNIVKAMVALDPLALHYRVRLKPMQAELFCQSIGEENTLQLVTDINNLLTPLTNGNHTFQIGREYSRVVYAEVVHAYIAKVMYKDGTRGYLPKPIVDAKLTEFNSQLTVLAAKYKADEFTNEGGSASTTWRAWWD